MRYLFTSAALLLFMTMALFGFMQGLGPLSGKRLFRGPVFLGEGKEWRMYPQVVDFDSDGDPDIIATHRLPLVENSLHVFLNDGKGNFSELMPTWSSPGYSGLAAGDINLDGKIDIIAASHFRRIQTYISNVKTPGKFDEHLMPGLNDGYIAVRLADLDADGRLEAIALGNEKAGIEVYAWHPEKAWVRTAKLMEGNIGRDLQVADMNADGRPDIVVSQGRVGVSIFIQDKNGEWKSAPPTDFKSATNEFQNLSIADLNLDGKLDIALNGGYSGLLKPNGPDVYLAAENSGGWKDSSVGLKVNKSRGEGISVTDVNSDGYPDLLAGGNFTRKTHDKAYGLFAFLGDGNGKWELAKQSGLPNEGLTKVYGIATSDLNADKIPDLIATHGAPNEGTGYLSIWFGEQNE